MARVGRGRRTGWLTSVDVDVVVALVLVVGVLEAVVAVAQRLAQPVRRRVGDEDDAVLADDAQVGAVGRGRGSPAVKIVVGIALRDDRAG